MITLCMSENCTYKDRCLRCKKAKGSVNSYANFEYKCNEESGYDCYIDGEVERKG